MDTDSTATLPRTPHTAADVALGLVKLGAAADAERVVITSLAYLAELDTHSIGLRSRAEGQRLADRLQLPATPVTFGVPPRAQLIRSGMWEGLHVQVCYPYAVLHDSTAETPAERRERLAMAAAEEAGFAAWAARADSAATAGHRAR